MSPSPRTPVLVGAAVADQRCDDPREALEPIALMIAACEAAARDAGSRALLARIDRVAVPRGFWLYPDPGRIVAEHFGAAGATTLVAEFGVLQQTLLADACRAIAAGESDVALVTGGDAKYRSLRAERAGVTLADTVQGDVRPSQVWRPHDVLWSELEWARGLRMPVGYYALLESALRHAEGLSLEAHARELGRLYADFSAVAVGNPHAWRREPTSAEAIATPGAANPMLAFPYAKLHTSSWNVDQAAGLILCSLERARALGIPDERLVFPLAASESNHMLPVCQRDSLAHSEAARIAGQRALTHAGVEARALGPVDLYSCFPVAVRLVAEALELDPGRRLTVTGGMPFAGGPVNNYALQATARMVEVLREGDGAPGLVSSVSGMFTKQGFGLWATEPPARPFAFEDVSDAVAMASPARPLDAEPDGEARIVGYTVLHEQGAPARAIAVCDLEGDARTVAFSTDAALMAAMMREEFCGRVVRVSADGAFQSS
ncbi:MAG: acetyl-CoA acetyltransferase [Myxococcales bacterium]|nr:acetyl-CoA acetyltransferase [Myxococcales bacterium]